MKNQEPKKEPKKAAHKPTKDEILFREIQAENQEISAAKTDNYYLTMFPTYFK